MTGPDPSAPPPTRLRVALVVSRFNSLVTEQLLEGAREHLVARGVSAGRIAVYHVPGAWELPQAAQRIANSGRHDALVALGCVIRGETAHFELVAAQANEGLGQVALAAPIPVVFGVLATNDADQAMARAGRADADKGAEFAQAALEMAALYQSLAGPSDQARRRWQVLVRPDDESPANEPLANDDPPANAGPPAAAEPPDDAIPAPTGPSRQKRDRSRSRAWFLHVHYRWEAERGALTPAQALAKTLARRRVAPRRVPYLERLVRAFGDNQTRIDQAVEAALDNWRMDRLSLMDRGVLRLGATEIVCMPEVPGRVVLQESVRLADQYGGDESPRFVNGVLAGVLRRERPR